MKSTINLLSHYIFTIIAIISSTIILFIFGSVMIIPTIVIIMGLKAYKYIIKIKRTYM